MSDLDEVLRAAEPETSPPEVGELRDRLAARRRRRRSLIAAPAVFMVVLMAVLIAMPIADRGRQSDDRIEAGPVTAPTPAPTLDPTSSPDRAEDGEPGTSSSTVADAADEGEWSMLVPGREWEVVALKSGVVGWTDDLAGEYWAATPADGPFGPVVVGRFNSGVETLDYEDGAITFEDKTTPRGTTVRVGYDGGPERLSAIFVVDGGSVAAEGHGLTEEQFLDVVDDMIGDNGRVRSIGGLLPEGMGVVELRRPEPTLQTSVQARLREGGLFFFSTASLSDWAEILRARSGAQPIVVDGNRGLLQPLAEVGDQVGFPGAVLQTDDRIYSLLALPTGPPDGREYASTEEILDVLNSLEERTASELLQQHEQVDEPDVFGLSPRPAVFEDWFAATPLPADHGLEWMAVGPPLDPGAEARGTHEVFACAWVEHWERTGDPAALDALLAGNEWPTGSLEVEQAAAAGFDFDPENQLIFPQISHVEQARNLTGRAARTASPLREGCGHILGIIE